MRKRTLAASLVGAIASAMLLTVSLPSCGCQEPWKDFLIVFGVEMPYDSSRLDSEFITAAANKHLLGKPLASVVFPAKTQPANCASKTERNLDCEFWFMKGPLREKGFHVVMSANDRGSIDSAKVTNLHRILGYRLIGS
jgi:hypothetical protein